MNARTTTLSAFLLLLLAPMAAATVPATHLGPDLITDWWLTGPSVDCDPHETLDVVAGSQLAHERVESTTRWRIDLVARAAAAPCTNFTFTFDADLEPWRDGVFEAPVASACGLAGTLRLNSGPEGAVLLAFLDVPAECEAAVTGAVTFFARVQPLSGPPYRACRGEASFIPACFTFQDARGGEEDPTCADGTRGRTIEAGVVKIRRSCAPDDRDALYVSPWTTTLVWVEARPGECVVRVSEPIVTQTEDARACPRPTYALGSLLLSVLP